MIGLRIDSFVEVVYGLIKIMQCVVAASQSIVDSNWILLIQLTFFEVFDGFADESRFQLGDAHVEVGESIVRLDANGCFKVSDGELVVAHVLVDEATLDVDRLVVLQQLLYFRELLQGFMEALCAAVH